jgi:arginine decarboxylase
MDRYHDLPVLLVENPGARELDSMTAAIDELLGALRHLGIASMRVSGPVDAALTIKTHPELGCVLVECGAGVVREAEAIVATVRRRNDHLPTFLVTEGISVTDLPPDALSAVQGLIWVTEDTAEFTAGRIARAMDDYLANLYPPFFGELVRYVDSYRYSWHTPGHMGGLAFRKSPVGRRFFDFFGENVFRADLSGSVPELGSILEHEGVVARAEAEAARVFGADRTWFVTNGTTMSNQVVFRGTVREGDIVVLDRNCHKSILNAVIQVGAIPVWLLPVRNSHGMIGPVRPSELTPETIAEKIAGHPLIDDPAHRRVRLAVVTNSTYDGTMYSIASVLSSLRHVVPIVLFDEAWIPYAAFHPVFSGHYAMALKGSTSTQDPTVFSTMSTHKMLASFSQGSMIHVREGRVPIEPHRFNEAFMMHASTSPQYEIVASLDVATRMMEGSAGCSLMGDTLEEAIAFRQEFLRVADAFAAKDQWFFGCWQPRSLWIDPEDHTETLHGTRFEDAPTRELAMIQRCWSMAPDQDWHGFERLVEDYAMLDPTKVSIITPGLNADGTSADFGVPAGLVARFLHDRGIVVEKTGFYTILVLFSIAVTRGKATTLLAELLDFKRLFDNNAPLAEALPSLVSEQPGRYEDLGLADLANEMHEFLSGYDTAKMQEAIYLRLPTPAMTPSEAFGRLVDGDVELVPLEKLDGRVAATLCVLYPPGIPVIVPGERFDQGVHPIVEYLQVFEHWAETFPGFENEMQGVVRSTLADGTSQYGVYCVTASLDA